MCFFLQVQLGFNQEWKAPQTGPLRKPSKRGCDTQKRPMIAEMIRNGGNHGNKETMRFRFQFNYTAILYCQLFRLTTTEFFGKTLVGGD
jgi:hypothetical protein